MKHRLYKVLRVIFLALAIISLVFSLAKKVGLCASSGTGERIYTKYPLPVGEGWGYGGQLTGEIVSDMIAEALALYPNMKLLCVPMVWDSNEMSVNVYTSLNSINFTGDIDDLNNPSSFTYSGTGVGLSYRVNLGGYTDTEYSMSTGSCVPSNYVMTAPGGSEVYLIDNVYIPYYPLYISSDVDPSIYNLYFTLGSGSGGSGDSTISPGSSSGSVNLEPIYDNNGNIIGYTGSIDSELELDLSEITGSLGEISSEVGSIGDQISSGNSKLDSIIGSLQSFKSSIEQKLEDIKGKIDGLKTSVESKLDDLRNKVQQHVNKITDFFGYMTGSFNEQEFQTDLQDLPLFQLVSAIEGNLATNLASFNSVSVTEPIFVFDVSGPVLGENVTFTLDLTSYEDYKHLIVPLITLILTMTFVFSLVNDLPDLFHGHSGKDNVN